MSEIIRRLAAINDSARAMNSELDPAQLLDTILTRVQEIFSLDNCAVLLFDESSGVLKIEAARGYRQKMVERFRAYPGEGITGYVFEKGQPLLVNDVRHWEGYVEGVQGASSEMAAPLRLDDQVIGVLDAESKNRDAFEEADLDLFRIFANQAATAIRNARLVHKLSKRSQELEKSINELALLARLGRQMGGNLSLDSLLGEVLSLAQKALNFDHCAILLREDTEGASPVLALRSALGYKRELEPGLRIHAGEGITGRVLATGQSMLVPDVRINGGYIEGVAGGRCEMATPLIVRGEVIGVFDAESKTPGAFDDQDLRLFSTFASWAAQALYNAEMHSRLEKKRQQLDRHVEEIARMNSELRDYAARIEKANIDLHQRVKELETLQEASRTITSSLDLDQTLSSIIDMTCEILSSSSCAIRLLDDENKEERWLGDSPAQDGDQADAAPKKSSSIAVPMVTGNKIIGYFELASMDEGAFSPEDQRVLQVLAGQAAIAIENARLFEHTQETYYETIRSLAQALEARDSYTKGHSERVTRYALVMADKMGLDDRERKILHYAGLLHDIGKIGISDTILHKRNELSRDEWAAIRNHPLFGDTILGPIRFLSDAQEIVLHHHERYDGSGYPDGLSKEQIPLQARIIAVADAFDAMTSDRPYRKALDRKVAMDEISSGAGKQFDPEVVRAFLEIMETLPDLEP